MTAAPFVARQERFGLVGSTNDIVREWLAAGTPEVCLAVADEQSAGRGREGRTWEAPAGRALLLSVGYRPSWLEPRHAWRLAANVALAMADAAEEVAGLRDGAIRLKWPNDLVILGGLATSGGWGRGTSPSALGEQEPAPGGGWQFEEAQDTGVRKLGGVLGESEGLGSADPRVVVGIGINGDWAADDFPPALASTMTSLRVASGGRPVDMALLLDGFLSRLEPRTIALRQGRFAVGDWIDRQLTTRRLVEIASADGRVESVVATGVDPDSGALLVEDPAHPRGERPVFSAEVRQVRLSAGVAVPGTMRESSDTAVGV